MSENRAGISCISFAISHIREMLELPVAYLTGNVRLFLEYWAGSEVASGAGGKVMHVVKILSKM